jgi:hypothetical protein
MATTTRRAPAKPVKPVKVRPGSLLPPPPRKVGPLDLEVVTVNADIAAEWLTRNVSNRVLRRGRLAEFKRDMLAGNWRDVGDPIRFDTNGDMCDGQHRMFALVNAALVDPSLAFEFLVIRGVQPEDRHVIDTGTRRSAGDQLKIAGYKNHTMLATAAKWCAMVERNALYASDSSSKSITHAEILHYVQEHPDLEEVVSRVANSLRRRIDVPPGYIAAAYYLCAQKDRDEADDFFERAASGVGLPARDPILALRSRLRDLDKSRANLPGEMWLGLLVRAWNARREGRTLRTLPVYKENVPILCPDIK